MIPFASNPSSLLRIKSVLQMFPVSRAKWYAGIRSGDYPKPVKIGLRAVAWRMTDILALIEKTTARV